MFVEQKFVVGLSDINPLKELTNTFLLRFLEDVASMHSEIAGYGITDMDKTRKSWILLSWKVEVIKRPLINDTLNVKTWSWCIDKLHAYRDFEVRNQYNDIVAIATSKWIFIDIDKRKIVRVEETVNDKYELEPDVRVFKDYDYSKLTAPENAISEINFKITRNLIDINKHLHNIYYLDIVKEALPENIAFSNEINNFEIMYKKEVKLGETVKAIYSKDENYHYVTIKSEDEKDLHAIIKLKQ